MKIGFYKFSSFSLVNDNLYKALKNLGKCEIEVVDVETLYPRSYWLNIVFTVYYYFWDILLFKRPIRGLLIHNPGYFKKIKEAAISHSKKKGYSITFQTQTLWDASCPGIPHYIYTDHTELAYGRYDDFGRKPYPKSWIVLEKSAYQNSKRIFTTSNFCKTSLVEDYNLEDGRIEVVYSGVNVYGSSQTLVQGLVSQNIVFVGTHWERKGGPHLLEAYYALKKWHPRCTLTIVGCDPVIKDKNGISVVGRVSSEKVAGFLAAADIFCMPSIAEPSSVAIVEAYAYGLPVVTTDVGGSSDRVIDSVTGFLVEYGNTAQLEEKLRLLLSDPQKRLQFSENGKALINSKFNWQLVASKIMTRISEDVKHM